MALIHYVIGAAAGWSAPTAAEVVAGTLAGGAGAAAFGSETSPSVTTDPFTFTTSATGLSGSTAYRIAFAWTDGSEFSNVVVSSEFTTLEATIRASIPAGSLMPVYRSRPAALSTTARPRT